MSKINVLIIDGFSLMFRAFYSFPNSLTLTDQTPINAVFGFITLLFKAIDQFSPDQLCICFDHPKPTFRKKIFSSYKANRPPPPNEFKVQVSNADILNESVSFYMRREGLGDWKVNGIRIPDSLVERLMDS